MKRQIISYKSIIMLFVGSLILGACKKENTLLEKTINSSSASVKIETVDGVLKFRDSETYNKTINELASLNPDDRKAWGQNHGVKTLQMIYDEILEAEEKFDTEYFNDIDPNLSADELAAIGKPVKFSKKYNLALQQGIIIQKEDQRYGGFGFELAIGDKAASFVSTKDGLVIIGDVLVQHTKDCIKSMKFSDITDIEAIKRTTTSTNEITVENITSPRGTTTFINGDIFTQSGVIWYYDSPNHRFQHYVYFYSNSGTYAMTYSFYTESIAERKLFGKWKIRNSYNPIQTVSGTWSYNWRKYNSTTGLANYEWNNLSGGVYSPYNANFGGSNHILTTLNPSGSATLNSPYSFYQEVDMHEYDIYGTFIGETDNYTTYYHN